MCVLFTLALSTSKTGGGDVIARNLSCPPIRIRESPTTASKSIPIVGIALADALDVDKTRFLFGRASALNVLKPM